MRPIFLCGVIALAITIVSAETKPKTKLKVAVYYETLCPDSKRFIKNQLYPVKKSSLGQSFDVQLVPYGKATTTQTSNSYTFECQHGQKECEGNKMHACAQKYIESTEKQLDFIYCSMSSQYPPSSLSACAKSVGGGIDEAKIKTCAEGLEGSELLAKNGEETHALKPKVYFVPWVTYNGKFDDQKLQTSQTDFKSVVCSELGDSGVSVQECEPTKETWAARRA